MLKQAGSENGLFSLLFVISLPKKGLSFVSAGGWVLVKVIRTSIRCRRGHHGQTWRKRAVLLCSLSLVALLKNLLSFPNAGRCWWTRFF